MLTLTAGVRTGAAALADGPPPSFLRRGAHVPALDALRGLAILLVILYHADGESTDPSRLGHALHRVLHLGSCGVDLFFVLSGYLITGILFDAKSDRHYFRDFYVRRTLRIFPLYYGVLAVAFLVVPRVTSLGAELYWEAEIYQGWLWLYAANVLVALKSGYMIGAFSHFWSLAVEEHFYLVWPLLVFLCSRRQAMVACLLCIVAAPLCRAWCAWGGNDVAAYVLTPCRLDGLAAGAWLALALRGPLSRADLGRWGTVSLAVSAALMALVFTGRIGSPRMDGTALVTRFSLSCWLFASLLVLALAAGDGSPGQWLWRNGVLRWLGKYSYGLYVFHLPALSLLQRAFLVEQRTSPYLGTFGARLVLLVLAMGGTVAAALASWHLYEKHFLKLKDVWAPRAAATVAPG